MKLVITWHAKHRLVNRIGIAPKSVEKSLKQNLKECKLYKQVNNAVLIECQDYVLGARQLGEELRLITAFEEIPAYQLRKNEKPKETGLKFDEIIHR